MGNLYHEDVDVDVEQVAGVLAAACILQFKALRVICLFSAMAITLGNLYHEDVDVDVEQVAGVLAAACILQFKALDINLSIFSDGNHSG